MSTGVPGTVYLLHFDRPYPRGVRSSDGAPLFARHYIGWTRRDLEGRLHYHRSGWGSRFLRAVAEAGIGWTVARTWDGSRHDERELKKRHNTPKLCPLCTNGSAP